MPVEILIKEYDRLTQAFINVCSCTYLLEIMDDFPAEDDPNYPPFIDACARAYLHEAQRNELHIMQGVFDKVMNARIGR